jgi:hypothetical protein
LCNRHKARINIFIHGGVWHSGLAKNFDLKLKLV